MLPEYPESKLKRFIKNDLVIAGTITSLLVGSLFGYLRNKLYTESARPSDKSKTEQTSNYGYFNDLDELEENDFNDFDDEIKDLEEVILEEAGIENVAETRKYLKHFDEEDLKVSKIKEKTYTEEDIISQEIEIREDIAKAAESGKITKTEFVKLITEAGYHYLIKFLDGKDLKMDISQTDFTEKYASKLSYVMDKYDKLSEEDKKTILDKVLAYEGDFDITQIGRAIDLAADANIDDVDLSKIDLKNVDLSKIDLNKLDLSRFDPSKISSQKTKYYDPDGKLRVKNIFSSLRRNSSNDDKGPLYPAATAAMQKEANIVFHFLTASPHYRKTVIDEFLSDYISIDNQVNRTLITRNRMPNVTSLEYSLLKGRDFNKIKLAVAPGESVSHREFIFYRDYDKVADSCYKAGERKTYSFLDKKVMHDSILSSLIFNISASEPEGKMFFEILPLSVDYSSLAMDVLNNSVSLEHSTARYRDSKIRANGNSTLRRHAFNKFFMKTKSVDTGDLESPIDYEFNSSSLERNLNARLISLKRAFTGQGIPDKYIKNFETREKYEDSREISYTDALRNRGKTGLSTGIIEDAVDLFGEDRALYLLSFYLDQKSYKDLEVERTLTRKAGFELFHTFNDNLLLEENKDELVHRAKRAARYNDDPGMRAGAAQFLYEMGEDQFDEDGKPDNSTRNKAYSAYLEDLLWNGRMFDGISPENELRFLINEAGWNKKDATEFFREKLEEYKPFLEADPSLMYAPPEEEFAQEVMRTQVIRKLVLDNTLKNISETVLKDKTLSNRIREIYTANRDALLDKGVEQKFDRSEVLYYGVLYELITDSVDINDDFLSKFLDFGGYHYAANILTERIKEIYRGGDPEEKKPTEFIRTSALIIPVEEKHEPDTNLAEALKRVLNQKYDELANNKVMIELKHNPSNGQTEEVFIYPKEQRMKLLSSITFGAYLLHDLGDHETAREYYQQAEEILEKSIISVVERYIINSEFGTRRERNSAIFAKQGFHKSEEFKRALEMMDYFFHYTPGRTRKSAIIFEPKVYDGGYDTEPRHQTSNFTHSICGHEGRFGTLEFNRYQPTTQTLTSAITDELIKRSPGGRNFMEGQYKIGDEIRILEDLTPHMYTDSHPSEHYWVGFTKHEKACNNENEQILKYLLKFENMPSSLPEDFFNAASGRYLREKIFLKKLGPNIQNVIEDTGDHAEEWGNYPFKTENMVGHLLLYKMGYLELNKEGEFVETDKYTEAFVKYTPLKIPF
ncbi:hypothetical protein ACFL0W_04610 [Nanoarchaeota archaeon]